MVSSFNILEDGMLSDLNSQPSGGIGPCHVSLDTFGKILLATNQKTSNVVVFKIDHKTGMLEFTGSEVAVPHPICVRFGVN